MGIDEGINPRDHGVDNSTLHDPVDHPDHFHVCAPFPGMENPPTEEQMQKILKDFVSLRSLIWDT